MTTQFRYDCPNFEREDLPPPPPDPLLHELSLERGLMISGLLLSWALIGYLSVQNCRQRRYTRAASVSSDEGGPIVRFQNRRGSQSPTLTLENSNYDNRRADALELAGEAVRALNASTRQPI